RRVFVITGLFDSPLVLSLSKDERLAQDRYPSRNCFSGRVWHAEPTLPTHSSIPWFHGVVRSQKEWNDVQKNCSDRPVAGPGHRRPDVADARALEPVRGPALDQKRRLAALHRGHEGHKVIAARPDRRRVFKQATRRPRGQNRA